METRLSGSNRYGPLRGFDYAKSAAHGPVPFNSHYMEWLKKYYPEHKGDYYQLLDLSGEHSRMILQEGGETRAVFVKENPIPRELYQTD